ncbi:hypothetical protein DB30_07598 [Enhygromyxa salina]|uniref:Uncharacterized protein n=1 Tax=Enhygromyxa salina TaxID=215803 RepID=A0A0C2D0U5_9BACT|nr:hypothetical protein DB30_07598 [Enhygromyxa salina]
MLDWPGMLGMADNAEQWARLREAIELSEGFALLFVVVASLEAETLAVEGLGELAAEHDRDPILLDARADGAEAPVHRLSSELGPRPLAVLRTHASLSRDREAFERCCVQLNGRRDQIVGQLAGPLVIVTRVDALRTLSDIAPDLFSVHAAQFHLSSAYDAGHPDWLLLPHEAFGLLGVGESFGGVTIEGMPNYLEAIPEVPRPLLGRAAEVGRLCAAMARSPGRIRVWGARGIGKSAVVAAAVSDLGGHYERVLWFHGWAAHTRSGILGAIVRALDVRGRCPADPVDIEARYLELSRAARVLIVVELTGEPDPDFAELPAPAAGSLLIEEAATASASADVAVEIGPLSAEHARALWARWTDSPVSPLLVELTDGRPGMIELAARVSEAHPKFRDQFARSKESWGSCEEILHQVRMPRRSTIGSWSYFAPAIPRRFLIEDLAKLESQGILSLDSQAARFVGRPDGLFDYFGREVLLVALARTTPPLSPAELEFVRRGLRLYSREWDSEDDPDFEFDPRIYWTGDWRAAPEALAQQALEALPVDERASFAAALAEVRDADEAFTWIRRAIVAAISSGQLGRAQRLLSNAAETMASETLDPIWLLDTELILALMPPAPLDDAGVAKLLFERETEFARAHPDAAMLARVRHGWSDRSDHEPPQIRVFGDALSQDPGPDLDAHVAEVTLRFDTLAKQTAHPELYAHFVHAHLCILELRRARWAEARRHLERVIDSAQTWGLAYPLLRAHLLAHEFALATGDLEPTTQNLDVSLARCDQLLGPLHPGTLAALTLGLRIREGLGQIDAARTLAEDCRRRLRYGSPQQAVLASLFEFYSEHGPPEVAASLRARMA